MQKDSVHLGSSILTAESLSKAREDILRNPSVLKTPGGDDYTHDTAAKWAWFAHGFDTGMKPFYSLAQVRQLVSLATGEAP
jgi:hypothetical protein